MSTRARDIFEAFRTLMSAIGNDIADDDYVLLMGWIAAEATTRGDSVAANKHCRRYPPGTRIRFKQDTDTGLAIIPAGALATVDTCDAHHVHATLDQPIGKVDFCEWDTVADLEKEAEVVT